MLHCAVLLTASSTMRTPTGKRAHLYSASRPLIPLAKESLAQAWVNSNLDTKLTLLDKDSLICQFAFIDHGTLWLFRPSFLTEVDDNVSTDSNEENILVGFIGDDICACHPATVTLDDAQAVFLAWTNLSQQQDDKGKLLPSWAWPAADPCNDGTTQSIPNDVIYNGCNETSVDEDTAAKSSGLKSKSKKKTTQKKKRK